jgi:pimeloyl-ACP methyl ester carboxylesterase
VSAAPLVILVHGFLRTGASMWPLARALRTEGFDARPVTLRGHEQGLRELGEQLGHKVERLRREHDEVHFVTHSMGGLVVRHLLSRRPPRGTGRVVMIAPPNQGSRYAEVLHDDVLSLPWGRFDPVRKFLPGERGDCLDAGVPEAEVGIIAGGPRSGWTRGLPWSIVARLRGRPIDLGADGEHDGTVRIDECHLPGARDFAVLPYTHTGILMRRECRDLCLSFLRTGSFQPASRGES